MSQLGSRNTEHAGDAEATATDTAVAHPPAIPHAVLE